MTLTPNTVEELSAEISRATALFEAVDLSRLNSIREHTPEDMTATVECGMRLADFQSAVGRHGQWVPLDPPGNGVTVGEMLAFNLSGPRRYGYGTVREYVIGMRVVLGSGEVIKAGGNVVKNVAGYDLCRLFIGAQNTLGIIVEATFKLRPLPEREILMQRRCDSLSDAAKLLETIWARAVEPTICDLHNIAGELVFVLGFAGTREDVEYQAGFAQEAGLEPTGTLDYAEKKLARKRSVLPSETIGTIEGLGRARFVARMGNGIVYYDSEQAAAHEMKNPPPHVGGHEKLIVRLKQTYDPKGILPSYTS